MTHVVYLYSKCSTCQKALCFLEKHQIPFKMKEIKETPPSPTELRQMLHYLKGNLKKLFNTSGLLYRELQLTDKLPHMTEEQALELLSKQGMLVKRPFLLGNKFGLVGFNEKEWMTALVK